MLQKNKNNKKVALSLICSRISFLLCQMKSITYTEIYPGMFYIQSSVPLGKGHLLIVSPFPQCPVPAGGDAEGALLSCSPGARLLPDIPHKPSRTHPHHQFLSLAPLMTFSQPHQWCFCCCWGHWRTGPFSAPLIVLECKYLLLGTLCRGLLFTAIKLRW